MGRRKRKVVHIPKKRLPKFFSCPKCGKETVSVDINREKGSASVGCSSCGLQEEFQIKPAHDKVDAYCKFTDSVYLSFRKQSVNNPKDS